MNAVAPVVVPQDGGQIHEPEDQLELVQIGEGLQLPLPILELEGFPEPLGDDILEELAEIDQPYEVGEVNEAYSLMEWPEVAQVPLLPDEDPLRVNMPQFYRPGTHGRPNYAEL